MKTALSLVLASCLACALSPAAPSPRAGDVIIEDTDTPPSPNPGAEDKAATRVRFVSLTPDILYEVDPARYVDDARTLAGAQLFYGARPDLLGAQIACVAPYAPIWRQELAERKKSIVWGRLDNLWPKPEKMVPNPKKKGEFPVSDFWARPSTSFYAWRHPQNAQKRVTIDFTLWKNWPDAIVKIVAEFKYKTPEDKRNIARALSTGYLNTTQHSFETCPWKDMLERGTSGNTAGDYVADADRVKTWQTAVNKSGRTIRASKLPWTDDWVEHAILYDQKGVYHQKQRAADINWGETFFQTLNQTNEAYDGFLNLKNDASLIDIKKNTPADHSRVIPFDARVKWSGLEPGTLREKVYLESDIAKAVVISDKNASPDFVVLAVACDCIKAASAEDAITILQEFRGKEVAVAEYIAEGTISGTGGKDSPLTYATGIEYAKGTGTGNLGSFTVKNPETLRYNRSVARLRSEETAAAYKAGITPRYKILFAVKETWAADPAKLTLTGKPTMGTGEDGKPAPLEENEGGDSLNGYTYVNMAVALNSATNITPVGSGSIELFRLPLPRAKYRLFQADVQAEKALENDIRMGFMDYTWTLRDDNKALGTDSSRIGRVFAVFGESTLKERMPKEDESTLSWKLILTPSGIAKITRFKLDVSISSDDKTLPIPDAKKASLLKNGIAYFTYPRAKPPVVKFDPSKNNPIPSSVPREEYTLTGKDYVWFPVFEAQETARLEQPWLDALEALTRHLLLQSKVRKELGLGIPKRDKPLVPGKITYAWPTNLKSEEANAVGLFCYGMRTMCNYNKEAIDHVGKSTFSMVLQYMNDRYFDRAGRHTTAIDLPQCTQRLCGGDHPVIICEEGVALTHALLSLCGMDYAAFSRVVDTAKMHAILGHGGKIYDPTPSINYDDDARSDNDPIDYTEQEYKTLWNSTFDSPLSTWILLEKKSIPQLDIKP